MNTSTLFLSLTSWPFPYQGAIDHGDQTDDLVGLPQCALAEGELLPVLGVPDHE